MNIIKENIIEKLSMELKPTLIEVIDESHLHASHNHQAKKGGTHFRVKIISKAFRNKSRVQRHDIVHKILDYELKNGLHALTLNLSDIR
tara:strand:+ start:5288 stop:5554 length:267 start_codon:yes stop_codon:yes gene_type:complete